jgi:phage baseplate assembly protein W
MAGFSAPLPGFRFVQVQYGDTPQGLCARELGDATLWTSIMSLNDLIPPYFTADPAAAGQNVFLYGASIIVPAPTPILAQQTSPEDVFLTDMILQGGTLVDDGMGDFGMVSGKDNLRQFLKNLLGTERGELIFHSQYGCSVRRLLGRGNTAAGALLASKYVRSAVEADPRVRECVPVQAQVQGDALYLSFNVIPIQGTPFTLDGTVSSDGVAF